ncbi:oligosaccharide biosynthesis protein Alg14 like-domain-containing protein [Lipomyces chichibuensis]|uniref:oligosaccharide biosynthesis protein Alg14 like-domain-containing protein n=1 Tax=Lipomyces chichibuensis TaxID=1546026 RepID=UPI003344139B
MDITAITIKDVLFFLNESRCPLLLLVFAGATAVLTVLGILAFLVTALLKSYALPPEKHPHGASAMFVLGSGGHTTELLGIVGQLDFTLYPIRTYVSFSGDKLSTVRALQLEKDKSPTTSSSASRSKVQTLELPRARNVGQSYFTSIFTSAACGLECLFTVVKVQPDIVVCNGPGSCVFICFAALLLRATRIKLTRLVYIESFARVNSLSLTGRILIFVVDRFIVQWPSLSERYKEKGVEYFGILA